MSLKDIFSIFKKSELVFIERRQESEDVYTFVFENATDLTWNAGQHGLFTITHKKIKDSTKPFTLASSPTEGVVQVTTVIGENPSEFKKALLELGKGMKIKMSGPVGSFYPRNNSNLLFIAGGIGITPFRAILKQWDVAGSGDEKHVKLLYVDGKKSYVFKDQLDDIMRRSSKDMDVAYLESREELFEEINSYVASNHNNSTYFIAGSKSMVNSIASHLKSHHILKRNIKKDVFYGY